MKANGAGRKSRPAEGHCFPRTLNINKLNKRAIDF
jgi:hypothetical protein